MDLAFIPGILDELLSGLAVTLVLLVFSFTLGNGLAILVALARTAANPFLRAPAYAFILFIRGTPLIVQMFMIYYGLAQFRDVRAGPLWPLLREPMVCAVLALTLSTGAYSAEVLRGALQAVPPGLKEAARALALPGHRRFRLVTLPLALRACLPSLGNETVLLLKASAICFTITVRDLMGEANIIRAQTFRTYEPLLTAAVFYLVLTLVIARSVRVLERRLDGPRRAAAEAAVAGRAAMVPPTAATMRPSAGLLPGR